MLKKTVTYTNEFGEEVTEDLYFNLTKAEIIEMEMEAGGGLSEELTRISKSNSPQEILSYFKSFIRRSYGVRTPEGKFYKNQEQSEAFLTSEAYSELFMEFMTDSNAASNFVKGVIPRKLIDEINEDSIAEALPPASKPNKESAPMTRAEEYAEFQKWLQAKNESQD